MKSHITLLLFSLIPALGATSCKDIDCGDGTIERDGTCAPATVTTGAGMCGPFTELQGDRCEPQFPPTECDPATTTPMTDPTTGVTTCIGTGGGGCSAPFACPTPTGTNKLTICGQFYDFETMTKFQASDAGGTPCNLAMPTATGPCALGISAYDAVMFASGTGSALGNGGLYIDDCGRYRVLEIDLNGTGPFIALGVDDNGMTMGPAGVTVTVGTAVPKAAAPVVANFENYIVKASTAVGWGNMGPALANGIYVASYRTHKQAMGTTLPESQRLVMQAGVTFAKMGVAQPGDDYYFQAAQTTNTTVDGAATVTGVNGTALVTNRTLGESAVFDGLGGLGTGCRWEPHAAATLPGLVFIQVYRKGDLIGSPGSCTD